jgi:hypothetical protein
VKLLPTALHLKHAPNWIGLGSLLFFASHYILGWAGIHS